MKVYVCLYEQLIFWFPYLETSPGTGFKRQRRANSSHHTTSWSMWFILPNRDHILKNKQTKNLYSKIYTNIDKTWFKWLFRSTYSFSFHFAESEARKHWRLGLYSSVLIIIIAGHWTCSSGVRVNLPWNMKRNKNIKYSLFQVNNHSECWSRNHVQYKRLQLMFLQLLHTECTLHGTVCKSS